MAVELGEGRLVLRVDQPQDGVDDALGVEQSHGLPTILAEARARRRLAAGAGERLNPAFACRRWAGAKQIGDLPGGQAGARHPALPPSRSIRPFA